EQEPRRGLPRAGPFRARTGGQSSCRAAAVKHPSETRPPGADRGEPSCRPSGPSLGPFRSTSARTRPWPLRTRCGCCREAPHPRSAAARRGWTRRTLRRLRPSRFCFVPPWVSSARFPGCSCRLPARSFSSRLRRRPGPLPVGLERGFPRLSDVIGVDELEAPPLLLGDLLDVALVAVRHDHLLDP